MTRHITRNTLTFALLLAIPLAIPVVASASTPNGASTGNTEEGVTGADVIGTTRLMLRRVETNPARVYLFDPETEKLHVVLLSEKTRLTARRKKDFDGRRKLNLDDLASGQTLKVTYRLDDGRVTGIQVLEKAS